MNLYQLGTMIFNHAWISVDFHKIYREWRVLKRTQCSHICSTHFGGKSAHHKETNLHKSFAVSVHVSIVFPFSCFQSFPIFQKIEFKQMRFQWALKSISLRLWSTVIRNVDKHKPVACFSPHPNNALFRNRKSSKTTIDLHCLTPQAHLFCHLACLA